MGCQHCRQIGQLPGHVCRFCGAVRTNENCDIPSGEGIVGPERSHGAQERATIGGERFHETCRSGDDFFRALVEQSCEGITCYDSNARICYVSPGNVRLDGRTPEETVGVDGFQFVHPDDVAAVQAAWAELLTNPLTTVTLELQVSHKDGSWIWVEATGQNRLKDPAVAGVVVNWRNITKRKQIETALAESEERYRRLFEDAPIGIYRTTPDGRFLLANPAAIRMAGCRTFEELASRNLEIDPPESTLPRSEFKERLERDGVIQDLEVAWRKRDGTQIFVREHARAARNSKGETLYYEGTLEDITQQKRVEATLRASETRFRELVESMPQLVWTCLPSGPCDYLSKQWIAYTGIPETIQLGYGWLEQLHPEDRERTVNAWRQQVQRGAQFDIEFRIRGADGIYRWFQTRAVPIRDATGQIIKWLGSNTDIDNQKRAEEALRASEAEAQKLARIASRTHNGVILADASGRIEWVNEGFTRMTGYTPDEVRGRTPGSLLQGPASDQQVSEAMRNAVRHGREFTAEILNYHKSGRPFWARIEAQPICDASGRLTQFMAIESDITERKHAEELLRNSEATKRAMFDALPDLTFLLDSEGRFLEYHTAQSEDLYVAPSEFLGRTIRDVLPFEVAEQVVQCADHVVRAGTARTLEYSLPIAETPRFYEARFVPCDANKVLVAVRNITARKQAEEALRQSEERFRLVWEHSPVGMRLTDANGLTHKVNPAFCQLVGLPATELEDRLMSVVYAAARQPEILHKHCERFEAKTVPGSRETEITLWNGDSVWIEVTNSFLKQRNDQPLLLLSIFRDITERRRTEAVIRELNASLERRIRERTSELQTILDSVPALIFYKDRQHRLVSINEAHARCYGLPKEQIEGKTDAELGSPFASRYLEDDLNVMTTGQPLHSVIEPMHTPLGIHWLQTEKVPLRDADGNIVGLIGLGLDITERKRQEDEISKLRDQLAHVARLDALGELASGLAHELNQPLTAMNLDASAALILGRKSVSADVQECLQRISDQSMRAGEIVKRMRSFVRKAPSSRIRADLNRLIRDVLPLLDGMLRNNRVRLDLLLDRHPSWVRVDAVQIQQVLVNLIRNAVEAMLEQTDRERLLTIRTEPQPHAVCLSITDSGAGIAPAILSKLFCPFQTTKADGLGLGLSISRTLIEAHGGWLEARPNPGGGTTFSISLPVASESIGS